MCCFNKKKNPCEEKNNYSNMRIYKNEIEQCANTMTCVCWNNAPYYEEDECDNVFDSCCDRFCKEKHCCPCNCNCGCNHGCGCEKNYCK